MNVLKHGSKLVSVGLLSLSLSAGFSGLAFARIPEGALTDIPNSTVLGGNAALDTASDRDLSTEASLAPSSASTGTTTPFPGHFTGTTTPSTGTTRSFPGQFTGQFNKTTSGRFTGTTTPRQSGEVLGKANRSSQAASSSQASGRSGRKIHSTNGSSQTAGASQRRGRKIHSTNGSSQTAGSGQASQRRGRTSPPSNVSSQVAGSGQASQRSGRTSPTTNAASQNSDGLLLGLIESLNQ